MNIAILIDQQPHLYINHPHAYAENRLFLIEDGYKDEAISLSLANVKDWGIAQIKQQADATRHLVTGDADPIEVAGWNDVAHRIIRIDQAIASPADQALIADEAERRGLGETPEQLLAKQRAKAQAFGAANTLINGETKGAKHAIQSAETVDEIVSLVEDYPKHLMTGLQALQSQEPADNE